MKISTIFIVGALALLLSAMPNTIQTFSGSHEYGDKECDKCHSDNINTGDVMAVIPCVGCHNDQGNSHSINLTACMSDSCHPESQVLYDAADPHRDMAVNASESTTLRNENEACFFCHANINLQFNFNRPQYIEFDIVRNKMNNWNIQNLTTGPIASQQISIKRVGRSHQWISGSEIECKTCHTDIIANISAHYPSSDHLSGDKCLYCHQKSTSPPIQHTARSVLCVTCHSDHKGNLLSQISGLPSQYQSNICIGCHNEDPGGKNPPGSTPSHFKIYLEPIYRVERIG